MPQTLLTAARLAGWAALNVLALAVCLSLPPNVLADVPWASAAQQTAQQTARQLAQLLFLEATGGGGGAWARLGDDALASTADVAAALPPITHHVTMPMEMVEAY